MVNSISYAIVYLGFRVTEFFYLHIKEKYIPGFLHKDYLPIVRRFAIKTMGPKNVEHRNVKNCILNVPVPLCPKKCRGNGLNVVPRVGDVPGGPV